MQLKYSIPFFILLVTPFFIHLRYGDDMEPYPAVMLPSGAGLVHSDSTQFSFNYTYLYGQNAHGEWFRLTPEAFLYPVRSNYFYHVVERLKWLETPPEEKVFDGALQGWMKSHDLIRGEYRPEQIPEFVQWIQSKLRANSAGEIALKIEDHQVVVNTLSGSREDKVISSRILNLEP